MWSVKLLCAVCCCCCCCGGWEPHLLPRSDERKRERERGEQLTNPQHLTTCSLEKPSDGLLVYHLSDAQFAQLALKKKKKKKKREKKCHFCRCCSAISVRPDSCGSIGESARENLDRGDAPESAYHDRDLFPQDRTWPTVDAPPGRKVRVLQHYLKTTPIRADQLGGNFLGRAAICHLLE